MDSSGGSLAAVSHAAGKGSVQACVGMSPAPLGACFGWNRQVYCLEELPARFPEWRNCLRPASSTRCSDCPPRVLGAPPLSQPSAGDEGPRPVDWSVFTVTPGSSCGADHLCVSFEGQPIQSLCLFLNWVICAFIAEMLPLSRGFSQAVPGSPGLCLPSFGSWVSLLRWLLCLLLASPALVSFLCWGSCSGLGTWEVAMGTPARPGLCC